MSEWQLDSGRPAGRCLRARECAGPPQTGNGRRGGPPTFDVGPAGTAARPPTLGGVRAGTAARRSSAASSRLEGAALSAADGANPFGARKFADARQMQARGPQLSPNGGHGGPPSRVVVRPFWRALRCQRRLGGPSEPAQPRWPTIPTGRPAARPPGSLQLDRRRRLGPGSPPTLPWVPLRYHYPAAHPLLSHPGRV
jgi:hypothetical protein